MLTRWPLFSRLEGHGGRVRNDAGAGAVAGRDGNGEKSALPVGPIQTAVGCSGVVGRLWTRRSG
jgi:hypothetical protein